MVKKNEAEAGVVEEEVLEECTAEEFGKMTDQPRGIVDWEQVWAKVNGRFMSQALFTKIVNAVRGSEREFYWSERQRVLKNWRDKGRKIDEKTGLANKRRMKFYHFYE
jgi:hypothetical protein